MIWRGVAAVAPLCPLSLLGPAAVVEKHVLYVLCPLAVELDVKVETTTSTCRVIQKAIPPIRVILSSIVSFCHYVIVALE